ncbi:SpvB/TcaC N-terminal domain-containing protein [Microcoleus sp. herbarium14]|uniref:SpvB/TcaC N-terminal domain-containing protein n=1 Tax=Microcoleus sp. herbarium14 TaxID=3055439 RepID=UPI002FD666F1
MFANSNKKSDKQATDSDKSYVSPPPTVSLPKGGGAIKGMGEKFATNPVTGTGSISVPIATSPTRSGFGPQLSLSYDSGAGNGIFGLGWNLSLPSITRKTDKGLPRYWDLEESDIFILSGAEDLVPVLKDGTVDETLQNGYRIRKYRPRIEGLFARIERWTKLDLGETHWRSISKDNITTLYGKTAESRIADPIDKTRIFSWLICESYDDKGNAIRYEYKSEDQDNSVGINTAQAHERNRTPESRSTNRYLKRIKYGNRIPYQSGEDLAVRSDWMFEVVFDYGEHDLINPIPNELGQWTVETVRNDPFSSYRSGFEVRTYRLCRRVLMFHHFPDEVNVGQDCLVRSTDFTYSYSSEQNLTNVSHPIYSLLLSVKQTGYKRNQSGGYIQKSLPPLEFTYSEANIDEAVREVDRTSLENLPQGLDGTRYQWVDLDGEGLSGILTEQGNGWFYKRNLSQINTVETVEINGDASKHIQAYFAPVELVASKPATGLNNGAQFLDLAGDGQLDLVTLRSPTPGFYERTHDEDWESFVAFKSLPNLDWDNPNLKFIDLNGDGHSDILITEDDCFVWHPSLAEDGFDAAERVYQSWDEEKSPRIVFFDSTQSIYLSDMSGDGLTDIVRIRNGEVCYWANLGYGRFSAKVTMDNSPWFDALDIFNQRRIVLADIDGSGTTDILYLSGEGVQVYFNQSGNEWSVKRVLRSFPAIDNMVSVTTIDLLGNGTACLVWSSPLSGSAPRVMRYIDLMGGQKPHLLIKTVNNMGAETVVQYAPSTKFYLQDKLAEKPWITKLPFPVHVVEWVETYDRISGNRFVTRYAYHHGYFDGLEREFRGFGMVEQWDTEEIGTIKPGDTTSDSTNLDAASFVPPVHTKTWFHTGVFIDRERISNFFAKEYYRESGATETEFQATLLPDTVLPIGLKLPDNSILSRSLTIAEEYEACRSLKGRILRQEIYAIDNSSKSQYPYSVSERNYEICWLQPKQDKQHAVFYTHDSETIDYHYERSFILDSTDPEPDIKKKRKIFDPRVTHAMTLEVDAFGNGLKSVAIAYPRRIPRFPEQGQIQGQPNKGKPLITYTENRFTNKPNGDLNNPDWYRIGVPIETRTYEITGLEITGLSSFVPYSLDFIRNKLQEIESRLQETNPIPKPEIAYEEAPDGSLQRRTIERVRTLYRKDSEANTTDLTPLPLGQIDSLALPCESFKLAFTPGLLAQVYSSKLTSSELNTLLSNEGKYVQQDGGWWIPSGRQAFEPTKFYLPVKIKDPFGNVYTSTYDNYHLLAIGTIDPLNNTIAIQNNYRTLQPEQITDPNGNRSQAKFDALGMVVATAIMGKEGENKGDTFANFKADLTDDEIKAFFDINDPHLLAAQHLGTATTRIIYDLNRTPVCAASIVRETHINDLNTGQQSKVQLSFVYSDGFGREAQTKVQAEPGPLDLSVPNSPILDRRWVGTGATIYNNKGKPVKQYEPFFSPTHKFGIEKHGVSSTLFYDPVERVVATLHPNHTYEKVVFDPWQQKTYDVNDTVTFNPKTDPDVGAFFTKLPAGDYLQTWYQQRINGALGTEEKSAAQKASKHADTPSIAYLDTLGRTFLTVADNGKDANGNDQKYRTHVELDIEGNQRAVTDALDRLVMKYDYDMLGDRIHQSSMEAGDRWMLNNVAGKPIRMWDSRNHILRTIYDELLRPTQLFVKAGNEPEILTEKTVYGEGQGNAKNHRGRIYQHFDSAGVATNVEFDFKGNLERSKRQLVKDYTKIPNWSDNPVLETEIFSSSTRYDALNRPLQLVAPHSSKQNTKLNIIRPGYNEANLLERMDVWLGETAEPIVLLMPQSANFHPVTNIDYNAKGQRTQIEYGNGAKTEYTYDEKTFRLTHLKTTRGGAVLQDLFYTYDPVGNITRIRDDAQENTFFNGQVVLPHCDYIYDAIYRLIEATGREHIGQIGQPETTWNDEFRVNLPHPHEGQAMRNYTEQYLYDAVGNFEKLIHQAANGNWTRAYAYNEASLIEPSKKSNRLSSTNVGVKTEPYTYDAHGNMTSMPHLMLMQWNYKDELSVTSRQTVNDTPPPEKVPETTFYVYDASGERVRKVTERQNGTRKNERIYLGGFEIYREFNSDGNDIKLERETLHIMDDKQRIVLVESKTITNPDDESPAQLIRFQFGNHLGSVSLELDDRANVISYEEYYPYGSTSYQAVDKSIKAAAKRYRYTGKERDEETGLYYHGARYYAAWLGRWTSCDPTGIADGLNIYKNVQNNPINFVDPTGTDTISRIEIAYLMPGNPQARENLALVIEKLSGKCYDLTRASYQELWSEYVKLKDQNRPKQPEYQYQGPSVGPDPNPDRRRQVIIVRGGEWTGLDATVTKRVEVLATAEEAAQMQQDANNAFAARAFRAALGGLAQIGAARSANAATGRPIPDSRPKQSGSPVDNTPLPQGVSAGGSGTPPTSGGSSGSGGSGGSSSKPIRLNLGGEGEKTGYTDVNPLVGNKLSRDQIIAKNPSGSFIQAGAEELLNHYQPGTVAEITSQALPSVVIGRNADAIASNVSSVLASGGKATIHSNTSVFGQGTASRKVFEKYGFEFPNDNTAVLRKK